MNSREEILVEINAMKTTLWWIYKEVSGRSIKPSDWEELKKVILKDRMRK